MVRYSKPLGNLFDFKKDFFEKNDIKLAEFKRIAGIYRDQPRRVMCKNCNAALSSDLPSFAKLDIDYLFCGVCGHLNGAHEDTPAFCQSMYACDDSSPYASHYIEPDKNGYISRMKEIYIPKAEFLKEALLEHEPSIGEMSLCDFGAGAGYFTGAAKEVGFSNIIGYEPSKALVDFGNCCLGDDILMCHDMDSITHLVETVDATVVSFICVLEHLREPRRVLDAISMNPSIKYFFFSVPLFSPTVILESIFNWIMPRHLVAGHTHLYTESSIDYFCNEFSFRKISEWWFGLDIADLFRNVLVTLQMHATQTSSLVEYWKSQFNPLIDDLQNVLDRNRLCSEVHILIKK